MKKRAEEMTSWDVATKVSYAPVFRDTSSVKSQRQRTGDRGYNRHRVSRWGRGVVGGRAKVG